MLAAGIPISLSIDGTAITGLSDMFSTTRPTLGIAHGLAKSEFGLTTRRMLELATIDGARGLGLGDQVGPCPGAAAPT